MKFVIVILLSFTAIIYAKKLPCSQEVNEVRAIADVRKIVSKKIFELKEAFDSTYTGNRGRECRIKIKIAINYKGEVVCAHAIDPEDVNNECLVAIEDVFLDYKFKKIGRSRKKAVIIYPLCFLVEK